MAEARHAVKPRSTAGSLHNVLSERSKSRPSSNSSKMCGKSSMSGKSSASGRRFMTAVEHLKTSKMMVAVPLSAAKATVKAKLQQVKSHIQDKLAARPSLISTTSLRRRSTVVQRSSAMQQSTEVAAIAVLVRDKLLAVQPGEHAAALLYARMRLDGLLQSTNFAGYDEETKTSLSIARDLCDVQEDAHSLSESVCQDVVINSCMATAQLMTELVKQCSNVE